MAVRGLRRRARHAAGPGRHGAPAPRTQPVGAVLLAITAASLGLVALLPSAADPADATLLTGQTASAATPPLLAAPVRPVLPDVPPDVPPHADRSRRAALPSPSPVPPSPPPPPPPPPDVLPGCTVGAAATAGYANGQIPRRALCALPGHSGHALRADAARGFVRLEQAYRAAFGEGLCVTDSYRSLAVQRTLARQKPRLAARPGTSEHGVGVAVDLACGAESYRTGTHRWLTANAGQYGWYQPSWARRGGSRPEPWHWEFDA